MMQLQTQVFASTLMEPQNFDQYNRGDMYFPAGARTRVPMVAAVAATPYFGAMAVHAIPMVYTINVNANARVSGAQGYTMPEVKIP